MHMKIRHLVRTGLIVTVFTLTGCSAPIIAPSSLHAPLPARDLQLATPVTYKFTQGLGVQRQVVLLPGIYKGVGEDGKGIWYLGNTESMTTTVLDRGGAIGYSKEWIGIPTVSSGGLFVPNDPALQPQVFRIYGERPSSGPNLPRPADNRDNSQDSRYWGFVPRENIIGRPLLIYWSASNLNNDLTGSPSAGDRLYHLAYAVTHVFQITRWERSFHMVR